MQGGSYIRWAGVRVAAFIRLQRWRHRPVRLVTYDAYWAEGHVHFDVNLGKLMYQGSPADYFALKQLRTATARR